MRIGIDLDNTISCTDESIMKYQNLYIKEKNITSDELWNNMNIRTDFLNRYLKDIYLNADVKENCVQILNKLHQENELYIITARTTNHVDDIIKIIEDYLKKHNIQVDGIFIDGKDKVEICMNNKIDFMIEDSYYNYERLVSNGIDTILLDEKNKYPNIKNRVDNWKEISEILNLTKMLKVL